MNVNRSKNDLIFFLFFVVGFVDEEIRFKKLKLENLPLDEDNVEVPRA
jgi:hypothetical protein